MFYCSLPCVLLPFPLPYSLPSKPSALLFCIADACPYYSLGLSEAACVYFPQGREKPRRLGKEELINEINLQSENNGHSDGDGPVPRAAWGGSELPSLLPGEHPYLLLHPPAA